MHVPMIDLGAQYRPLRDEILAAVTRVCDSQQFVLGAEVAAFEEEIARLIGVEHAVAVSSGTDALLLSLMALGIGPGDEVITSAYSFFATAGAVVRVGARPVFADIDPATFNADPAEVAAKITSRTRAILPVHLFGLAADMDPICAAAAKAGISVIEDAAQAIGATYRSRPVGSIGACGCFSFYPSKNLGAFGDAGLLTTNDAALADRARLLRTHGMEPRFHHRAVGANFRMDALQAAVLRVKVPHLAAWTEARRLNASRYFQLFREAGLDRVVGLPIEPQPRRHVFNQFVVTVPGRDGLRQYLSERGIETEVYYPVPLHLQPCFDELGYREGDCPNAEAAARASLAIPMYGELALDQQRAVVETIATFVRGRATGTS
jgi:dTDP-4-amino-4,6-dideoxygalactose transaminase